MPVPRSAIVKVAKQLATTKRPVKKTSVKQNKYKNPRRTSLAELRQYMVPTAPFPVGRKEVYLPNFTVALQYHPLIPPTHAQFQVPLNFNKFDLRDYLWHAYGVRTHSIRSQVVLQPIRYVEARSKRDVPGKKITYRPRSLKRMIVKLDKPFVWPAKDKNPNAKYNTDMFKRQYDEEKERSTLGNSARDRSGRARRGGRRARTDDSKEGNTLVDYAQMLVEGKLQWKTGVLLPDKATSETSEATPSAATEGVDAPLAEGSVADAQSSPASQTQRAGPIKSQTAEEKLKGRKQEEHERKMRERRAILAKSGLTVKGRRLRVAGDLGEEETQRPRSNTL